MDSYEVGFGEFEVPDEHRAVHHMGLTQYITAMKEDRAVVMKEFYTNSLPEVYAKANRPFSVILSKEKQQFEHFL